MTNGSLMKVDSIAECQYFRHALRDNWSIKTIFGLFESGCFTQILPYNYIFGTLLWAPFHNITK